MQGSLSLSSPASHTLYVDSDGELYGDSLAGTVHVSGHEVSPESLWVALVRTIRFDTGADMTEKSSTRLKARLPWRKTKHTSTQPQSSSSVEEVIRCNLSPTPSSSTIHPDGSITHDFDFALTSPIHTPETVSGTTLEVSYELTACVTTQGAVLTNSRPLQVLRRRFPDPWDIATHSRGFPESNVKAEFTLSPQLAGAGPCTCFAAEVQLRNVVLPATRPSELTVLVMQSLSWYLDEIITWDTKSPESTTTRSRTVARGSKKGRWTALQKRAALSESAIRDMRITVPFQIGIDKAVNVMDDLEVDARSPGSNASLTVRHQLRVEIVMGKETVSRDNGSLVARRPSVRGFGATIPVPLHSYADTTDVMKMLGAGTGMLPVYEKIAMAPPEYREVVGPV